MYKILSVLLFLVLLASGCSVNKRGEYRIFTTENEFTVKNLPVARTTFIVDSLTEISKIKTYHWNEGNGSEPGTISLRGPSGEMLGPWDAKGLEGKFNKKNVIWEVTPGVVLQPGEYEVIVSKPETWSYNEESLNRGFVSIYTFIEE